MEEKNYIGQDATVGGSKQGLEYWDYLSREIPDSFRYGKPGCPICAGLGIAFDPQGGGWDRGALKICDCMEDATLCDRKPPYEYYDPEIDAVRPCPSKPARIALERIQFIKSRSGIPKRYEWKFIPSIYNDQNYISLNLAISSAVHIIKEFGNQRMHGLYLHGGTGTGKTLISTTILNELVRLYQTPVLYAKITRDILGKLRASFNPNSDIFGEGQKIESELATVPVLVIDDFGVHRETEWVTGVLYDLIDSRYESNLLTIITSNERLDSWKDIGKGRVYSRLVEMCEEIHIDVPDFRIF